MATTEYPELPKAKEWHREHFRRQRSNTSTQPQTSRSQWRDWSGWQDWAKSIFSSRKMVKEAIFPSLQIESSGRSLAHVLETAKQLRETERDVHE